MTRLHASCRRTSAALHLRVLPRRITRAAYTLIEVLAASAVIGVGMTAAVSLSSTLMIQEELSWRVAVVRNHQENMLRLWQLGLNHDGVMNIMPSQADSTMLNQVMFLSPKLVVSGTSTSPSGLGSMETASVSASVNVSLDPALKKQGSAMTFNAYRPALPAELRPPAP